MKYISCIYITLSIYTLFGAAHKQTADEMAENRLNSKLIAFASEELKQAHKQENDSEIQAAAKELARLFLCESSQRQLKADKVDFVGREIANNELVGELGKQVSNELLKKWNNLCVAVTNRREFSFKHKRPMSVNVLRYNHKGTRLATGDSTGAIHEFNVGRLWDVDELGRLHECAKLVTDHQAPITELCYDADNLLTSVGTRGIIKRWDAELNKADIFDHGSKVLGVCYTPQGKLVSVGPNILKVWDVNQSGTIEKKKIACNAVSFSNDGSHMILLNEDKAVVWNLEQMQEERACELGSIEIARLCEPIFI